MPRGRFTQIFAGRDGFLSYFFRLNQTRLGNSSYSIRSTKRFAYFISNYNYCGRVNKNRFNLRHCLTDNLVRLHIAEYEF